MATGGWSRGMILFAGNVIGYCRRSILHSGIFHRILHMGPELQDTARFHHFQRGHGIFWSLFTCNSSNHILVNFVILSRNEVLGDDYNNNNHFPTNLTQLETHDITNNDDPGQANDQLFNNRICRREEHEAYEEVGLLNDAETNYLSILDDVEEQEHNEIYDFIETNNVDSNWDQAQEENEVAIDDQETDDELLDSEVEFTSDWDDGYDDEDEALMAYVADWEDSLDMTSDEENDVSWYVNEDGSLEVLPLTNGHLSEEIIAETLKTRDSDVNSDEEKICVVCQECLFQEDDKIAELECGHEYHVGCIMSWLIRRNSCPLCKAKGI